MIAPDSPDFSVGIVGAGLMGAGIVQVAAKAGINTRLYDSFPNAAQQAKEKIAAEFERLIAKDKLTHAAAGLALSRIHVVEELSGLAVCNVVIEAIIEDIDSKRDLFARLEGIVSADCILATNTSSLSVTAIAAACTLPGRVGGLHFFSPVPLMKVVEVIQGVRSDARVGDVLASLAGRLGHTAVRAQDTPGFIVNHAGRGYGTEALRIHSEGIADFRTIDLVLRDGAGFRMGPFELMDLTGLDVSQPVMDAIYHQYFEEPRFRPTPLLRQRRLGGLLGRKSGEGFYRYVEGAVQHPPPASPPAARPVSVWVGRQHPTLHALVSSQVLSLGGVLETNDGPSAHALCVVTPVGRDATCHVVEERLDPQRTIAIDAIFGTTSRRTLMATPVTTVATCDAALGLFQADGVPASLIRDSAGFISQRVVAHIVNIACEMAQQSIATPTDIDLAVTLGLGYRRGPLAMGDAIGATTILEILRGLQEAYGDPRYRPSPWLVRRATLGLSLLTTATF